MILARATVDENICVGCGRCIDLCPINAIVLAMLEEKRKAKIDIYRCIGCYRCIQACPQGAIKITLPTSPWKTQLIPQMRIQILKTQAKILEHELERIKNRLDEFGR